MLCRNSSMTLHVRYHLNTFLCSFSTVKKLRTAVRKAHLCACLSNFATTQTSQQHETSQKFTAVYACSWLSKCLLWPLERCSCSFFSRLLFQLRIRNHNNILLQKAGKSKRAKREYMPCLTCVCCFSVLPSLLLLKMFDNFVCETA